MHSADQDPPPAAAPPTRGTRVAVVVAMVVLGALLTTSARLSPQTDEVRIGRGLELVELIRAEQGRNEELAAQVARLVEEVEEVQRSAFDPAGADELTERVDELALVAGLVPLTGPAVLVTLSDASSVPTGADVNDYIIHEEDLQAVINALWAGGAEAIAVNGQRVLATTAIRCVGNTLLLHGVTYPPPYEIHAIGDAERMNLELDRDLAMQRFDQAVAAFDLGYEVEVAEDVELPAYEGVPGLSTARPVEPQAGT